MSLEKIKVDEGNKRYSSKDDCNAIIDIENNTLITGCKNTIIHTSYYLTIGERAFEGCEDLKEIVIPEGVTKICDGAFLGCKNLESVVLQSNNCEIGRFAFAFCKNLKKIYVPKKQVETYKKRFPKEAQHLIEGF